MTIPKSIHQIWLGDVVPDRVTRWQASWSRLHPDWSYRLWRDHDFNWLQNARQFDLAQKPAIKADVARLEVLCRHGGIYVDSDIEAHRPIDDLTRSADLLLLSEGDLLTNAFMGCVPDHLLMQTLVRRIGRMSGDDLNVSEWALSATGPLLLTQAAVETSAVFQDSTRILPGEAAVLPRSKLPEIVSLAEQRRWMTHHAEASWRNKQTIAYRLRSTQLRTRMRRFLDLSAP